MVRGPAQPQHVAAPERANGFSRGPRSQALYCIRELGLPADRVNVNGGDIYPTPPISFVFTAPPEVVDPQGGPAFIQISLLLAQGQWAMQQVVIGALSRNEALALRLMIHNIEYLLALHEQAGVLPAAILAAMKGGKP